MMLAVNTAIAIVPVLLFLFVLFYLDSFRLVRPGIVGATIVIGGGIAIVSMFANQWIIGLLSVDATTYTRYGGPILEETLKAGVIVFLIMSRRADFLVDSAIYGFAVGAGFAVVENVYYLHAYDNPHVLTWAVRGFGTAVMHGTATAAMAMLAVSLVQRKSRGSWLVFIPPLVAAILLHSAFNHFVLSPVLTTVWLVALLPILMLLVYERSERTTRQWLGVGIDTEMELLEDIMSDRVRNTRVGQYLQKIRSRFSGEIVADMLCFLRIHLELSIGAKGLLLMRGAGLKVGSDPEIQAKLDELKFLEKSLGRTGRLAIQPFLRLSRRDLWQLYMLER
jgi:RsiW-degrading membrane proteinase PrsW (M82 family)